MAALAGFVLVGGQSRRMGRDKALLPWDDQFLAQHVADCLLEVTDSVSLLGDPARYGHLGFDCIPDLRPGLGPLSGIEAMLFARRAERNLLLACDMPGVPVTHLQALAQTSGACVVTEDQTGQTHPLCAVYDVTLLPAVQSALDRGRLRLQDLIRELNPCIVRYPGVLANINTSEDLLSARR